MARITVISDSNHTVDKGAVLLDGIEVQRIIVGPSWRESNPEADPAPPLHFDSIFPLYTISNDWASGLSGCDTRVAELILRRGGENTDAKRIE